MKRLISIAIAILAVCLGLAVWSEGLQKSQGDTGENTLNLFNWGDYIDPRIKIMGHRLMSRPFNFLTRLILTHQIKIAR